ncbi:hypothetical protein PV371_10925 [Streptomyces sp. TX20-6-3]|uniref:hypothetical protein n=1 Tax=Streptomyces sp. TX20-6-3 TaxID=3028705 RepID=UPI0029B5AD6E|nr:hypothetical protein [Streptomyces sp. TX20-6-3]MDX2560159.1 hypothetical protein [Streptomyces sp. TX20-6-3]
MTTSDLPRRTPGASGRTCNSPEPAPGAPSRALRMRAAAGWVRFMRRAEAEARAGTTA